LGIHIGHDSSAALVVDGRIVADVAEERFTRTKHYCGLPLASIDYCLKSRGIAMADLNVVAVPTDAGVPELNFLLTSRATGEKETISRAACSTASKTSSSGLFPSLRFISKTF